jgi:hypothetical protein
MLGTIVSWTIAGIAIIALPALTTLRFVLVVRDTNDGSLVTKSGLAGGLGALGKIGLFLTSIAAWIAAVALVVLMVKGDGAGIGATVILGLLIVPYGISEILIHAGTD